MSYRIRMNLDVDLTEERVSQIREEFLAALEAHSLKTENFECKQGSLIIDLVFVVVAMKVLEGFLAELGASIYRGLKDKIVLSAVDNPKSILSPPVEMKNEEKMPITVSEEAFKKQIAEMLHIPSISHQEIKSSFPCLEESLLASLKGTTMETSEEGVCRGIEVKKMGSSKYQITRFQSIIVDFEK